MSETFSALGNLLCTQIAQGKPIKRMSNTVIHVIEDTSAIGCNCKRRQSSRLAAQQVFLIRAISADRHKQERLVLSVALYGRYNQRTGIQPGYPGHVSRDRK